MKCKYCKKDVKFLYTVKINKTTEVEKIKHSMLNKLSKALSYYDEEDEALVTNELYTRERCCKDCLPNIISRLIVAEEL